MYQLIELSEESVMATMNNGEFPREIISSAERTAVVLTQDWCPQWHFMDRYLRTFKDEENSENLHVYYFLYNHFSRFEEFMTFKETVLKNKLIPFVLYFRDGTLVNSSNYVSKFGFIENFS